MGYYDQDIIKLKGLTLTDIKVFTRDNLGDTQEIIEFVATSGERFHMFHEQDCCESVTIDEIIGDLTDLIGDPILLAESVDNLDEIGPIDDRNHESYTWTFYKLSTIKGNVTIRWYGSSNGYYSEAVTFKQIIEG